TAARAMNLMLDVARGEPGYEFVEEGRRARARHAVEIGTDLILELQLADGVRHTGWAQQYDERTLEPLWGRMFEPVGLAARESAGVLGFLMRIEDPDPGVRAAVRSAAAWLESVKIEGV